MTNELAAGYRTVDGLQIRYADSSYPEQLPLLTGLLPQIFTPVQIITGRKDPTVPVANAEFLHARLPNSRLDVLDTGHLAWEEAPGDYGTIIATWVTGGYLTGSAATAARHHTQHRPIR